MALNQRSEGPFVGIERYPSGVKATTQTIRIGAKMKVMKSV
jgi:hypothetical protein